MPAIKNKQGYRIVQPATSFNEYTRSDITKAMLDLSKGETPTHFEVSCFYMRAHFYYFPDKQEVEMYLHRFGKVKPVVKTKRNGKQYTEGYVGGVPINEHRIFSVADKAGQKAYRDYIDSLTWKFVQLDALVSDDTKKRSPSFFTPIGHGNEHQDNLARIEKEVALAKKKEAEKKKKMEEALARYRKEQAAKAQRELAKIHNM